MFTKEHKNADISLVSMNTDKEQIIAELERILNHPRFRARKLIRLFLQYAVLETLADRGQHLNQYTIAVNALGKPKDFSPVYNPVVRIEAGRLRKLLQDYYAENGDDSPVMISIPKGSYQASFKANNRTTTRADTAMPSQTPHVTEGPRIAAYCQLAGSSGNAALTLCHKLHNDLLLMMSRFRNIRLVSPSLETCPSAAALPSLDNLRQHRVDYLLNCDIQIHAASAEVFCTLLHIPSNELVWTDILPLPAQPAQANMDAFCMRVAANTITLHSGKALSHWAAYQQSLKLPLPSHQQVLVDYLTFLRDISQENFTTAQESCQQRLEHFPDDSRAMVILARLCGYDHVLQYNLLPDMETLWTHAARMAMKLDPGGAESHSVFAHNSFLRGDFELCRAEFEIARKINPFDTSIEYLYGLGLYLMGDEAAGMQSFTELTAIPFTQPDWYHLLPFIDAFNRDNYQQALSMAEQIQQFGYWGEMARSVSYFRLGQHERCLAEFRQLLQRPGIVLPGQGNQHSALFAYPPLRKLAEVLQEIRHALPLPAKTPEA